MYAADGRVTVNGQTVQLTVPMTYQRKQLPFVVRCDTEIRRGSTLPAPRRPAAAAFSLLGRIARAVPRQPGQRPADVVFLAARLGNLLVTLTRASTDDDRSIRRPTDGAANV